MRGMFTILCYPHLLIESIICKFNQIEPRETPCETQIPLFMLNYCLKVNYLQKECAEKWYLYKQKLAPKSNSYLLAKRLAKIWKRKKANHLSLTNSAFSTIFNVICVIQIMSGIRPGTYTNAYKNTNIL